MESNLDQSAAREALRELLRREAVMHGDFVLSSGKRSSYYVDARLVTLSSAGSALVGRIVLDEARAKGADAVAGLTVGADPIVAAVITAAGMAHMEMRGLIVRKEAKAHGTGKRIEGPWREGLNVVVVDDTLTTGSSALVAADAIEEAGGTVRGIVALIDREQGAREAIAERGFDYRPLFSVNDLL